MLEDAKLDENTPVTEQAPRDEAKAWETNFTLGGVNYAASLFWQSLQRRDDPFPEIIDASENVLEGADLFTIKPGKATQFGLCVSFQGYKKGMPAAAVALATAWSDRTSFLAVFKVDKGWWYVCARNDIILSDGDMLFVNEQDAKDQFMSMLAVPDWGRKIAPAEWGIDETENPDLAEILQRGTVAKLEKIRALRGAKLLAVWAAAGIVGIWLISTLVNSLFLSAPKKPLIAPVPVRRIETPPPPPPEPKPWESVENPTQVLAHCYYATQAVVQLMTPGWKLQGITCNSSSLVTSWRREIGRITWIDKALNNSGLPFTSRSISPDGNSVIVSIAVDKPQTLNSPPDKNQTDLINTINDLFQALEMPISMQPQTWTSPQQKVYRLIGFSFGSTHNPLEWNDLLTKFSGLKVNTIRYNVDSNNWQYEGAIYVL